MAPQVGRARSIAALTSREAGAPACQFLNDGYVLRALSQSLLDRTVKRRHDPWIMLRLSRIWIIVACVAAVSVAAADQRDPAIAQRIATLEAAVQRDPENLFLAAEYRQLVIAAGDFDRSIKVLEALAHRKTTGPNIHISLGLAYVDKVPTSGDIRRLYLARDAINEATRAIDRQPSVLAFYMRGRINISFNNFIFHRVAIGIQDLQKALALITPETAQATAADVYAALGDGSWKLGDRSAARDVWRRGAERYPDDARLKARLSPDDAVIVIVVWKALLADTRVDTTLRDFRPRS